MKQSEQVAKQMKDSLIANGNSMLDDINKAQNIGTERMTSDQLKEYQN